MIVEKDHCDQIEVLLEQSRKFQLCDREFTFDNNEPIFFRSGPNLNQKPIKKCPSCRKQFQNKGEMVFCTYCGHSNCKECSKKTRIYPNSQIDHETGKRTERGTICKLCDRKFHIKDIVQATSKLIEVQNISIKAIQKNLDKQCNDTQIEIGEDEFEKDNMINLVK